MTSDLRCVVFDFDGTLVDSYAIKRDAYFEILRDVPGSADTIERVLAAAPQADRHGVLSAVHAELARAGAARLPDPAEWVAAYAAHCQAAVSACAPLPGAVEALDALGGAHALYIASATPEDALLRIVAARGWTRRFAGVYGGPRSKLGNLQRAALREGLQPRQLVYVGDGAVDRRAAEAFGCRFLGAGSPSDDPLLRGALAPLAPLVRSIAARVSAG